MIFFSLMVNAWSLAASILNGTFDKEYPVVNKDEDELDYEIDYMETIDDQYSHHFFTETEEPMAHYFKYHEEEILKDIQEYVSGTYQGHYTGKSHEYRNVQTIDLMASKELAAAFCQANILKYLSLIHI